jgi:hypothetical protein
MNGERRDAYRILVGKSKRRAYYGNLDVDGYVGKIKIYFKK